MGIRPAGPQQLIEGKTAEEVIKKIQAEDLRQRQGETLLMLDQLRRTRKARGGVGAPLHTPAHLGVASLIVVTDADVKGSDENLRPAEMDEEERATRSELVRKGVIDPDEE